VAAEVAVAASPAAAATLGQGLAGLAASPQGAIVGIAMLPLRPSGDWAIKKR